MHLGSVSFLAPPLLWSLSESEGWEAKPGASLSLQSGFPSLCWGFVSEQDYPAWRWILVQEAERVPAGSSRWCAGHVWTPAPAQSLHIQVGTVTRVGKGRGVPQAKQKMEKDRISSFPRVAFFPLMQKADPVGGDRTACCVRYCFCSVMKSLVKKAHAERNIMKIYFPIV